MQYLHADYIGHYALQLLQTDPQGVVLVAVSKALYLETESGEVIWLHSSNVPRHARGVQVSQPIGLVSAGLRFRVRDSVLLLEDNFEVDLNGGEVWDPPIPNLVQHIPLLQLPARRASFIRAFRSRMNEPNGILSYMVWKKGRIEISKLLWPSSLGVQTMIEPILQRIMDGCQSRDLSYVLALAREMIGLGSGLTPSGDDFIGGLLFAQHGLRTRYSLDSLNWPEEISDLLNFASTSTNLISYSLLSDHASGSGVEPLHHFVNSLLSHVPIMNCIKYARQLERLGSSTGQDLIAGVLTGMKMAFAVCALHNEGVATTNLGM